MWLRGVARAGSLKLECKQSVMHDAALCQWPVNGQEECVPGPFATALCQTADGLGKPPKCPSTENTQSGNLWLAEFADQVR